VQTPASHAISSAVCVITVSASGNYSHSSNPTNAFVLGISQHVLTFTKRDDGGNPVPGAVFHIAGSGVNATANADTAGRVTFAGLLSEGSYILSERSAPGGYTKTTGTVTVSVASDGTYSFDNDPEAFFINQRDTHQMTFTMRNDGGVAVSGAKFKLDDGKNAYEATSELGTGRVLFRDIPFGVYHLTQSAPAEGYPAVPSRITVTIYPDGGISFTSDPSETFVAERTRYAFSFTAKEERGGNLEGATFKLAGKALSLTEKSIAGGKVSFGNLLPGTYTLSQTATPAGFSPSKETVTVKVAEDGAVTFSKPPETTIVATVAKFSVSFDKMDDLGAAVGGAVFRLKGTDYERDVTSSTAGKVSFSGLLAGTYTLTEQTAPTGYTRSAASVSVTVSTVGLVTYSREPAQAFANARSQNEFSFITVDDAGAPFAGAVFTLSGEWTDYEGSSNKKGRVTFAKIPHGVYMLRQKKTLDGYTRSPLVVQVTIEPNGRIFYENVLGEAIPNVPLLDLDGVFVNASGPTSFSFSSVADNMTPLGGAEFALVNAGSGATAITRSNPAGIATFYGIQPGEYTVGQTAAPERFTPSADQYALVVKSGGIAEVFYRNAGADGSEEDVLLFSGALADGVTTYFSSILFTSEREKYSFSILCRTQDDALPIVGAVFSVTTHPEGEHVSLLVSGEDGRATLGGLATGSYRIAPESIPTGYEYLSPGEPFIVRIVEDETPDTALLEVVPTAVEASAPPTGLFATIADFVTGNTIGVASAGVGTLALAAFLALLLKRSA